MVAINVVHAVGTNVSATPDGYYRVLGWYLLSGGGRMQAEAYDGLTWEEAADVVASFNDCHRPGWALGDGWHQPSLLL